MPGDLVATNSHANSCLYHSMNREGRCFISEIAILMDGVEQKVRLLQNYFARDVLQNCGQACVFCGFAPHSLGSQSGLLRASHIKPWSVSNARERLDLRNGLAACPMHDAAFDRGYLTVEDTCNIVKARIVQESIERDQGVRPYFADLLNEMLILPINARKPAITYLEYHRLYIFRDDVFL